MNPVPDKGLSLRGQAVEWLMRLQEAPHDQSVQAEFQAWLSQSERHRKAYDAVEPIWRTGEDVSPARLARATVPRVPASRWRGRRRMTVLAVTALAACLVFFAFPVLQVRLSADHLTGTAERREVVLDDGSRVTLDARSAVAVDYSAGRRDVRLLSGQAFFEVVPSPDRPFTVAASDVAVTVTGTSFSVGTSDLGVSVAVQTGTVRVSREDRPLAADLTVGQRIQVARDGRVVRGTLNPEDVASWKGHRLVVHDATVREVAEQIGRYAGGVIVFADEKVADRLVTGVIDLQRPTGALDDLVELQHGRIIRLSPYVTVISSR